jgi:hypothetical protein
MDTWAVTDPSNLSNKERAKGLSSLLFLKEKRCGKIRSKDEGA